jgi:hypothetical protein
VFAALQRIRGDADEAQEARDGRGDPVACRAGVAALWRRRERTQDRERKSRGAPGRVDRDVDRFAEAADPVAVLAPFGEAVLPGLGRFRGEQFGSRTLARGFGRVDPGLELRGREAGEGQHQV